MLEIVGALIFMAVVAVYLRLRKNASEEDKTVSSTLTLALLAAPLVFLIYYLIGKL